MLAFNEIATDERETQQGANQVKIYEFCFATMTSGVRFPSGPPSITLITSNLNENWSSESAHGAQPWGRDSRLARNLPISSHIALTSSTPSVSLPFSCPLAATHCESAHTALRRAQASACEFPNAPQLGKGCPTLGPFNVEVHICVSPSLPQRPARPRAGTKEVCTTSRCEAAASSASCRNASPFQGIGSIRPCRDGAGCEGCNGWNGVVHGEVNGGRLPSPRSRVGHHHGIVHCRGLVARAQADGQLGRTREPALACGQCMTEMRSPILWTRADAKTLPLSG